MMKTFEQQHPRSVGNGRFVNSDAQRQEAGSVNLGQHRPRPAPPRTNFRRQAQNVRRFEVMDEIALDTPALKSMMTNGVNSKHLSNDRGRRLSSMRDSAPRHAFAVTHDGGVINNVEIHVVHSNAEIHVYSLRSRKLITVLFARPGQVARYYADKPPSDIMNSARDNVAANRNSL